MSGPVPTGARVPVALYVDVTRGPYAGLGVDCWGIDRDARTYVGPHPVVAHPPCGAWGRYAHRYLGNDADCGPRAVEQVRAYGGVLEHPRDSRLWSVCRLPRPGEPPDAFGGFSVEVYQSDFGHAADKRTWLYIVGAVDIPAMPPRLASVPAAYRKPSGRLSTALERMSKTERHLTPPAFAAWLLDLARQVPR